MQKLRNELERRKGERDIITRQLEENRSQVVVLRRDVRFIERAQEIIQSVAKVTQESIQYYISDLVSMAMELVFEDPYKLKVDFVIRRGKTECDLMFERDGEVCSPLMASGGGAVDVAGFALRIVLWGLRNPRSRNVLILDEPFKYLSIDLQNKAGEMLRELSRKLKIQIIMVSHVPDLIEAGNKVFMVKNKKGLSKINT